MSDAKREKKSHIWARDPLDFYVETEACVEALFDAVPILGDIYDPACGIGTIPTVALRRGKFVYGSDIVDRLPGEPRPYRFEVLDFVESGNCMPPPGARISVVCNPPFSRALGFIDYALKVADHHVAMLLPIKFLASQRRREMFRTTPVSQVLILSKRPSMPPGAVLAAGGKRGGGKEDFCWVVWNKAHVGAPQIGWLA